MVRVEPLSHTADVGFRVEADSLDELFRGAAEGLVRTLRGGPEESDAAPGGRDRPEADAAQTGPGAEAGADEPEALSLERPDRERLLVAWLREILYRVTAEGRFPAEIDLSTSEPASLEARIRWSPPGEGGDPVREVKGITYHGLRVERTPRGRWHARLVLDV